MEVRTGQIGNHPSEGMRQLWAVLRGLKLTQGKAAKQLGTSSSLVNRWLHGNQKPGRDWIFRIETEFGIDPELWNRAPERQITIKPTTRATKAA